MDALEKLIETIMLEQRKCINEISNQDLMCNRCPYGYMDSTLNFNCAIKQLTRDVDDVKRRTQVAFDTLDDLVIDIIPENKE